MQNVLLSNRKIIFAAFVFAIAFLLLCSKVLATEAAIMQPVSLAPRAAKGGDEARLIILAKGKLTLDAYLRAVNANFPKILL